jgi:hypothetical protein
VFFEPDPRIRKVLEKKANLEDDRFAVVEAQLMQAKLIAEEADRKYEEVNFASGLSLHGGGTFRPGRPKRLLHLSAHSQLFSIRSVGFHCTESNLQRGQFPEVASTSCLAGSNHPDSPGPSVFFCHPSFLILSYQRGLASFG